MNWLRIWTGTLLAGLTIWLLDLFPQFYFPLALGKPPYLNAPLALTMLDGAIVAGFFCSWLYAVMRPRLGPGPRTALIAGSAIYCIKQGTVFPFFHESLSAILWAVYFWFKLVLATYIAGWQYIEKAP